MRRIAIVVAALATAAGVAGTPALACATLTPEGEAMRERQEARFLARESDRTIKGTWRLTDEVVEEDSRWRRGYVEVKRRGKVVLYRLSIPDEINCGFPYYYVQDGQRGIFYLQKTEYPDPDDAADGIIDDYTFIHFIPKS